MTTLELANGYYDLPAGKLANVVTCLEMSEKPAGPSQDFPPGYELRKINPNDLDGFRKLFRSVGEDLMWFSRLIMSDEDLHAILAHPDIDCYFLFHGETAIGIMELNFRDLPNCELAFFGLVKTAVGTGLGRCLMDAAKSLAWAKSINRLWVHTCHFDHPNALAFYQKSGFKPYQLMIEIHDDPRQHGKLPRHASPHVALIEPA
jgi:GNAT superfamily N-acetyltransferase